MISKRLRRLETRLGSRLLQRTTRQISLTEAGQGFFERVVAILAGVEEAEAFVSRRSTKAQGTLKITAPTSFGRMHIAPHLARFMAENPDLAINLTLSDDLVDIVAESYDVAIRIAELADSSMVARKLAPVRRILCAAPDYLNRQGYPASFDHLSAHNCLSHVAGETWRLVGPKGPVSLRPGGSLTTNSSEVVREAVLAGIGIGLRSTWDIGPEIASGKLVQVLPEYEGSRDIAVHAIYPSRQFLPVKVRLFIDFLADIYGTLPYWEKGSPGEPHDEGPFATRAREDGASRDGDPAVGATEPDRVDG